MKRLLGGILIGIGILIAGASGLCSLVFMISVAKEKSAFDLANALMILAIGSVPFGVGLGLFLMGRALVRGDDRRGR